MPEIRSAMHVAVFYDLCAMATVQQSFPEESLGATRHELRQRKLLFFVHEPSCRTVSHDSQVLTTDVVSILLRWHPKSRVFAERGSYLQAHIQEYVSTAGRVVSELPRDTEVVLVLAGLLGSPTADVATDDLRCMLDATRIFDAGYLDNWTVADLQCRPKHQYSSALSRIYQPTDQSESGQLTPIRLYPEESAFHVGLPSIPF